MRIALKVAYIGTDYHGFQVQPDVNTIEGELFRALQELNMDAPARWFGWMVRGLLPLTSYTVTIDSLDEDVFFITDRHRKIETRTRDDGFRREIDQKIQNLDNPFLQFQGVDLQILRPAHARAAMLDQLSRSFASDLGFATLTKAVSLIAEPSHESRLIELLDNQREPDRRLVLAEAISRQYNPVHFARVWKVLQEIDQTERELETSPDHVVRTHGSQVGTLLNLDRNEAVKVARTVASRCRQHSVWLQRIMASVLASCRHEGAADLLAQMAGCSSDAMTRDIALLALAALDRTAPVLRTLLSPGLDLAPATESLVSIALGAVGSVEDVELLKPRLHLDGHPLVRQGAIIGLGMIGQPAIAPPLLEALRDADAASRCRITWGLGRSGDPSVMPLLGRAVDKGEGALGELAWAIHTLGGNAAIPLLEKLSRWEPTTPERTMERAHAVLALVECGKGPDTDALIEATRDSNRYVAGCALIALGSRGGRRAEDHLRAIALRHADSRLRITAMKELVTMGVPCLKLLQDLKTNKTESRQITNVVAQLLPLVESAMPRTVQVRLPGFLPFLRTKDRLVTGDVRHVLARGFLSPGLDLANAVEIDSGSRPGSNFNPYLSFRAGFNRPDFLRLERPTVNRSGTGDVLIHLESSENQQILGFLTVSLFDPAR